MNEKLSYATMLEIPVNTALVTYKKPRRKLKKKANVENPKEELIERINNENNVSDNSDNIDDNNKVDDVDTDNQIEVEEVDSDGGTKIDGSDYSANVHHKKRERKHFRFSVIGVQVAVICLLVASIFITNAIYSDSGINVFLSSLFDRETTVTDTRIYKDFAPVVSDDNIVINDGVMTFNGTGSIYAPCDGKVTSVSKDENGKFTIEITHSDNFKTVLKGIENAYAGLNDRVYHNIPVGYTDEKGITMCFTKGDGSLISNYTIVNDTVVWAV